MVINTLWDKLPDYYYFYSKEESCQRTQDFYISKFLRELFFGNRIHILKKKKNTKLNLCLWKFMFTYTRLGIMFT